MDYKKKYMWDRWQQPLREQATGVESQFLNGIITNILFRMEKNSKISTPALRIPAHEYADAAGLTTSTSQSIL